MITIGGEQPTLEVRVLGGDTYHVPLLYSLTPDEVREFTSDASDEEAVSRFLAFFSRYVPEEVVRALSMGDIIALIREWHEESRERSGMDAGESSASPSS